MSSSRSQFPKVQIGPTEHDVVPQKIGYLRHAIEEAIETVQGTTFEVNSFRSVLAAPPEVVHPFLRIFYPKLMPLWQFAGFGTQDAYERSLPQPVMDPDDPAQQAVDEDGDLVWAKGERSYDPTVDESPDPHQIVEAFKAGFAANDMDLAKGLIDWVPFDELRAWVRVKAAEWLDGEKQAARDRLSPTTSSTSAS